MLITSLDNDKIKMYKKLHQKKYRDETGLFLVEGQHLVLEAYKSGLVEEFILEQDEVLPFSLPTVYVTSEILKVLTSMETPSNLMALCRKKEEQPLGKRIILLDGIQDPGNLGTIIRSAVAFDIDSIVLGNDCVDLYNEKTIRSTQGMLFHTNIVRQELKGVLTNLKKEGIPIYGTRVEYGEDVRHLKEKDKTSFALVMGNEGNGVRQEIMDLCDMFLYIEMNEVVESLNVGVATSIILYELNRR